MEWMGGVCWLASGRSWHWSLAGRARSGMCHTQELALGPTAPNPELLQVFDKRDFQDRSKGSPAVTLLGSQS